MTKFQNYPALGLTKLGILVTIDVEETTTNERENMSWTTATRIRNQKSERAVELAQRANITDVEKARAIKDKYVALLNEDPANEKNQKLYRWSLQILLGARTLAGEKIWV